MAKEKKEKKGKGKNKETKKQGFAPQEYDPNSDSNTIPAGTYLAELVKAILTTTKAGSGTFQKCEFKIVDGEYKNRMVFHNFNITNPNPQAVEIGHGEAQQLSTATEAHLEFENFGGALNCPVSIKVSIRKDKNGEYEDQNVIRHFAPPPAIEAKDKKKKKKSKSTAWD